MHRATLRDYATALALYRDERDALEQPFIADAFALRGRALEERRAFSARCFADADAAEANWLECVAVRAPKSYPGFIYRRAWQGFDHEAGLQSEPSKSAQ